jgi:hypothetical protein
MKMISAAHRALAPLRSMSTSSASRTICPNEIIAHAPMATTLLKKRKTPGLRKTILARLLKINETVEMTETMRLL